MTSVVSDQNQVSVHSMTYGWQWCRSTDMMSVTDGAGRLAVRGPLRPLVVTSADGGPGTCDQARVDEVDVGSDRLAVRYKEASGALLTVEVRFHDDCFWFEPLTYQLTREADVVSVHYFASDGDGTPEPALAFTYLVHPGICENAGLSPILPTNIGLDVTTWLGRGGAGPQTRVHQQWGLPAHYFAGVNRIGGHSRSESRTVRQADSFCCGLADLPTADFLLAHGRSALSPVFSYRGDLWGHLRGPGAHQLGARLIWALGEDYRQAVRRHHAALVGHGFVTVKTNTAGKNRAVTASQFNTWGEQCAQDKVAGRLDQQTLEAMYRGLLESGMRPTMFVIDDKWEGSYGMLEHCRERFPRFEEFLRRVRSDGFDIGMWAAFFRTDDPTTIGLTGRHLLKDRSGRPIEMNREFAHQRYYLFDISQDEVQDALSRRIRRFVERYDPSLVKFDFGYELPPLSVTMPADPTFAGELLLQRGLDLLVSALRAAKPEIAVMYYSLSPLFVNQLDQHCHDDMYMCVDDYDLEGNRRLFFSSVLAELGVPTYGSGGYDWATMPNIWFDSVIGGTVGSLGSLSTDEHGQRLTTELAALFNGVSSVVRASNLFTLVPVRPVTLGSVSGGRSGSWLRYEDGRLVMAAVRPDAVGEELPPIGVRTDAPVVVASMTAAEIASARRIGVVPFGAGRLELDLAGLASDSNVLVRYRRFGGTTDDEQVPVRDGVLALTLPSRAGESHPLEWVEIETGDRQ